MKIIPLGARIWMLAALSASAQSSQPSPSSPEAAAAYLWNTILATCPVPREPNKIATYYGNPAQGFSHPRGYVKEYRDAWRKLFPREITEADRLNGIQYKGLALLGYSASRTFDRQRDKQWSPFEPGTKPAGMIRGENDRLFGYGQPDPGFGVGIEKVNSEWFFTLEGEDRVGLKSLAGIAIKKSCAELTGSNPFALDIENDRKMEEERASAERKKQYEMNAERQRRNALEYDLSVDRDFGETLLCAGTELRDSLVFDNGPLKLSRNLTVKIAGASDKGGVLGEWLRVKPISNARLVDLQNDHYFVQANATRVSCNGLKTAGLISSSDLAEAIRIGGTLDRWPEVHRQAQQQQKAELDASAVKDAEFIGELTAAFQALEPKAGINSVQYASGVRRVAELVHFCSSISAAEFAGSIDRYGMPRLGSSYLHGKYADCGGGTVQVIVSKSGGLMPVGDKSLYTEGLPYVIWVEVNLTDHWLKDQKSWNGPKLHVHVQLLPMRGSGGQQQEVLSTDVR